MIRFLTSGESHGPALLGIIDGIPAGLPLLAETINHQLERRQQGFGRGERMNIETDRVEILGGVRYGMTTGAPIGLLIRNKDWANWQDKLAVEPVCEPETPLTMPRPGHADYAGAIKYYHSDIRNVIERASARETAMRVAIGAVCRELLAQFQIAIGSHVIRIGEIKAEVQALPEIKKMNEIADHSPLRCLDELATKTMMKEIERCHNAGDTLGGEFVVIAAPVPVGLGSFVQTDRRLDGILAHAILSIPAVKSVSIGSVTDSKLVGSEFHDRLYPSKQRNVERKTNRAGGIEGGVTNGEPIIIHAIMKPLSSLAQPLESVELKTGKAVMALKERSDVCAVPAAAVVAEHVMAIELANALIEKVGGDSIDEMKVHFNAWGSKWNISSSPD